MTTQLDYDIKSLDIEELDLDLKDWSFQSVLDSNLKYRLRSKEPIEYIDFKNRYLLKNKQNQNYLGYCVQINSTCGVLQEDLIADFLY